MEIVCSLIAHMHITSYQVQTQIFVSNIGYCDFCVCSVLFLLGVSLVFTLSGFSLTWFWVLVWGFIRCLLPRNMVHWLKRQQQATHPQTTKERELSNCRLAVLSVIAKSPRTDDSVEWIGCDNPTCSIRSGSILHVLILLQFCYSQREMVLSIILINKNVIR